MLSFVVPAHDEEASIAATLRAIRSAAASAETPFEIIVVDDTSSDRTTERAMAEGAQVLRIERRQIAAARNAGARAGRGDVFVFVDADTLIGADVVNGLLRAIGTGAIGGGAAVRFDAPTPRWLDVVLPASIWLARQLRITGGCFLFCRR